MTHDLRLQQLLQLLSDLDGDERVIIEAELFQTGYCSPEEQTARVGAVLDDDLGGRGIAEKLPAHASLGGRLVLVDSFQRGDEPGFDGLLELFPLAYHEPYFADYVRHDLGTLFEGAGLQPNSAERAHMSKVMTFDKP